MIEIQSQEIRRIDAGLGEDQFQFVSLSEHQLSTGFGADTDPVDPLRRLQGSVGLDGRLESGIMEGIDQYLIELQQRLSTGADHKRVPLCGIWP